MTVFPPLLWHREHLSYFSTVCSGNFYKTNTKRMEGSASPGVHTKHNPPPVDTGRKQAAAEQPTQYTMQSRWEKHQLKHLFQLFGDVKPELARKDTNVGALSVTQPGRFRKSHEICLPSNPPTLDR